VKLVIACCILHNWTLSFGVDEVVPEEFSWVPNVTNTQPHATHMDDNVAWLMKRDEWANHMWANRGLSRI
jgi:hypothetical protein